MNEYHNPNQNWFPSGYDHYKGMTDKERMRAGCMHGAVLAAALIMAAALCALLSSCTTTQYVPVVEYHTDTLRQTKVERDSIYLSDSVYINDFVRDDTVWRTEYRWRTKYIERTVHDTTYIASHDTVPQPYPVTEYVTRPRSKIEWGLMAVGTIALISLIVFIAARMRRFLP